MAALLAYDGSGIDGGLYTTVTHWAQDAPHWLDRTIQVWSNLGLGVFALFMLWAWWQARRADSVVMARVLASPVIVVLAYLVNSVLKSLVHEVRPCQQLPNTVTVEACPAPGDWSFPSNHSVIAFAAATALIFAYRRLGWVAMLFAALMAASRVWIGVHYPHDVVVGLVVGVMAGVVLGSLAGRFAPLVDRLRGGALGAFLGAGPAAA
jgi:undecaprenyl-diphosphatase